LAKLLFTGKAQNKIERVFQKLKEWVVAVSLEKDIPKKRLSLFISISLTFLMPTELKWLPDLF
jgi:hypothetical protein